MGRKGTFEDSKGTNLLSNLGLTREDNIDVGMFDFYNPRYGSYAKQLAQDVYEYGDENQMIVSYSNGNNKAYAVIDPDANSLDALVSTGGRTGTQLLSRVMQYQQKQGKGLIWMTDNKESRNYYDQMGLGKFKADTKSTWYEIDASQMEEAIKLVNKRLRK